MAFKVSVEKMCSEADFSFSQFFNARELENLEIANPGYTWIVQDWGWFDKRYRQFIIFIHLLQENYAQVNLPCVIVMAHHLKRALNCCWSSGVVQETKLGMSLDHNECNTVSFLRCADYSNFEAACSTLFIFDLQLDTQKQRTESLPENLDSGSSIQRSENYRKLH